MNTKLLPILAIAAILFASCSNDRNDTPDLNDGSVKFTSGITLTPKTRVASDNAGISTWNVDDPIGIYMVEKGTYTVAEDVENISYKAATAGATTSFNPMTSTIYYPVNSPEKVSFIAYHPYTSEVNNWAYPVDVSTQTPQTNIDLMVASADNAGVGYDKSFAGNVNLAFSHQLVKLIINISTGEGVEGTVSEVSIKGLNTSAKLDLQGTAGFTDLGTPQDIIPHEVTVGREYEAILLPLSALSAAHTMTITTTEGETFIWKMSENIESLTAGRIYTYDITLTKYSVDISGNIKQWTVGGQGSGIAE